MASTNILNGDSGIQNGRRAVDDNTHNGNESTVIVNVENVTKLKESSVKGCANIGYGRYFNISLLKMLLKY